MELCRDPTGQSEKLIMYAFSQVSDWGLCLTSVPTGAGTSLIFRKLRLTDQRTDRPTNQQD